jgi:hypothetical protein
MRGCSNILANIFRAAGQVARETQRGTATVRKQLLRDQIVTVWAPCTQKSFRYPQTTHRHVQTCGTHDTGAARAEPIPTLP